MPISDDIQRFDRDRYLCSLFAPEKERKALHSIYALNLELAKIPEITNEHMIRLIRLQWWREAIEEIFDNKIRKHEVVEALADVIKNYQLQKDELLKIIDGREDDIENINNLNEIIKYVDSTAGDITVISAKILKSKNEELARHIGVVWGLVGLLRSLKFNTGNNFPEIGGVIKVVEEKLITVKNDIKNLSGKEKTELMPVLLLIPITEIFLKRIKKAGYDVINTDIERGRTSINLRVLCVALFKNF